MRSLPKGKYALSIAHPGHELRLYSFLEQASPFVFILTDGSHKTGMDMMFDSIQAIDRATKLGKKMTIANMKSDDNKKIFKYSFPNNPEGQQHLKDLQVYSEIIDQKTEFFEAYINFISKNLIKYDIDHLISDPSEGYNVCHEITRIMSDIAIQIVKKKTGKQIFNYDFSIEKPYNDNLNDECIHIQLDEKALDRKFEAIIKYPYALLDMKPNISLDINIIIELSKLPDGKDQLKTLLKETNLDFFKNEYLRPYVYSEPSTKPMYEISGEKAVKSGKYFNVISYNNHLKPLREKLQQIILGNAN